MRRRNEVYKVGGRVCCQGDDWSALCPNCKVKASAQEKALRQNNARRNMLLDPITMSDHSTPLTPAELFHLRQVAGHSLQDLGKVIGVGQMTCHRYEAGVSPIPADLTERLKSLIPLCDAAVEAYQQIRTKIVSECLCDPGEIEPETKGPAVKTEPEPGESAAEVREEKPNG